MKTRSEDYPYRLDIQSGFITHYVVGIVLSDDLRRIALVRKARPAWQAGRLNGVGGHVEPNESAVAAMRREFREETGVDIFTLDWHYVLTLVAPDGRGKLTATVDFFTARTTHGDLDAMRNADTSEPVVVLPVEHAIASPDLMPNLRWLIPVAIAGDSVRLDGVVTENVRGGHQARSAGPSEFRPVTTSQP